MAMLNTVRFAVCCFLLLTASTITQIRAQISQTIVNAGGLDALEVFHVAQDGTIMVRHELDIMTPLSEFIETNSSSSSGRDKKSVVRRVKYRWPNAIVPYEITSSIRDYSHGLREAMDSIMKLTCLRFVENDTAIERIQFNGVGAGCWAPVGYFAGKIRDINLSQDCRRLASVQHEILHTLGVIHEQSRFDRDKYVKIFLPDLINTPNYVRESILYYEAYSIEYDYRSIMHYQIGQGVMSRDLRYLESVGKYTFISIRDITLLNIAYGCTEKLCCNKKKTCPFGGVVIPNDYNGEPKCQCWCSSGKPRNEDQLVLCSSLNTSMEPVYQLTIQSSLLDAEDETCNDLLENCASYKKKGMCFTELMKMKKLCSKTCNFCGKGQDLCTDNDGSCAVMAEAGVCKDKGMEKFMNQLCPKSCGKCTEYYSACDLQRAMEEPEITINSATINFHWIMSFVLLYIHALIV